MTDYMLGVGCCVNCSAPIVFNPERVPSIRVNGSKEPLCLACAERWIRLHPEARFVVPADAYEPCREDGLPEGA